MSSHILPPHHPAPEPFARPSPSSHGATEMDTCEAFLARTGVTHTYAGTQTDTQTHTSHMAMMDTCANAYLHDGGVFVLDSCSTSQGLAVCQTFISLCHQMKHGPLDLWAGPALFLWLLREAGRGDIGSQGNLGGNGCLGESVQWWKGVNEDINNQNIHFPYCWNVYLYHENVHFIGIIFNMSVKATTMLRCWIILLRLLFIFAVFFPTLM